MSDEQTKYPPHAWVDEIGAAITVIDKDGIILEMNQKSIESNASDGGADLIGKNVMDCHPELAGQKLQALMDQQIPNSYTIEKNGIKKFVQQMPWYVNGEYQGLMEIVFQIPFDVPNFIRKNSPDYVPPEEPIEAELESSEEDQE